jgi:hypothetical protein
MEKKRVSLFVCREMSIPISTFVEANDSR